VKKLLQLSLFSLSITLFSTLLFAEGEKPGTIAIVDIDKAVMATEFAKKESDSLNANPEYKTLVNKFETLKADLLDLEKKGKTNGMTWSAEQRAEHRNKMEYKSADMRLAGQKIEAVQAKAMKKISDKVSPQIEKTLRVIIEERNIDLLLDAKAARFAEPGVNITKLLTERLNKSK